MPHPCQPLAFAICPDCHGGPDAVACELCGGDGRVTDADLADLRDAGHGEIVSGGEDEH